MYEWGRKHTYNVVMVFFENEFNILHDTKRWYHLLTLKYGQRLVKMSH